MDFRITIEVKDVARGDIKSLIEQILEEHGDAFDVHQGDFIVSAAVREGNSYFPYDWEEEEGET